MKLYNGVVLYNEKKRTVYGKESSRMSKGRLAFKKKAWPKIMTRRKSSHLARRIFKSRCQSTGNTFTSLFPYSNRKVASRSYEVSRNRQAKGRPKSSRVTLLGLKARV